MTNLFDQFEDNEDKKVVCLGMEFDSDEKRRDYFRKELRKKLPELKKMDGFPIGEDDDIIELSDPPYYTACPNPWLNDFIGEWESEKKMLEKQGKRKSDFVVVEPYASDINEGKNSPEYNAHSYHTKVPHAAIMRYILYYTQPGDIIYDGFAGTGMTGVAGQACSNPDNILKNKIKQDFSTYNYPAPIFGSRKTICGDLSPIASFISGFYNKKISPFEFNSTFDTILDEVSSELSWLYKTLHSDKKNYGTINYIIWSEVMTCKFCNSEIIFWNASVSDTLNLKKEIICPHCNGKQAKKDLNKPLVTTFDTILNKSVSQSQYKPVLINYLINNKRYNKKPDHIDLEILDKIQKYNIDSWFPANEISCGIQTNQVIKRGYTNYHHLYTKRNLIVLSKIWNKFYGKSNHSLAVITSILTKTASILHNIGFKGGNINLAGALPLMIFVPSLFAERNIFHLLERKKNDFNKINFEKLNDSSIIQTSSATKNQIGSNTIDYIFTDPPFGDNISYSELNLIQESWLRVLTNINKEAIVDKNQSKGVHEYQELMIDSFKEFYRVLKPGKWMTVEFSNTSALIWNLIQLSISKSGFVIANVAALDKGQGSFMAQTTTTAVKQDLVISCYKPTLNFNKKFKQHNMSNISAWDFIEEHLNHLPVHSIKVKATTAVIERRPKILFDRLIAFYVTHNLPVPIDATDFQRGLRERFEERDGMFFTHEQLLIYEEMKNKFPEYVQASIFVASEQDGIYWLKQRLEKDKMTYQDIQPDWMQSLAAVRKGDSIPELKIILEENFLKDEAGRWYYPDQENLIDLEKLRHKRLMKEFNLYLDAVNKPKAKTIKEVRVDALRAGFKECYQQKDFKTIVKVAEKIPQNLLMEDEFLLQFYDIAMMKI